VDRLTPAGPSCPPGFESYRATVRPRWWGVSHVTWPCSACAGTHRATVPRLDGLMMIAGGASVWSKDADR
jgi:hypothetical protein